MNSTPIPKLTALALCDLVIEDKLTNNKTLVGLFNQITANKVPCTHPRMAIFISLTDGRGKVPINVRLIHLEKEEKVFSLKGEASFGDPTESADVVLDLRGVPLKFTGVYSIEVLAHGELLGQRKFLVKQTGGAE